MAEAVTAEVISIGTELLLGDIVDTHAATMARVLASVGIGCRRRTTVGDNLDRIVGAIRESLDRANVVVCIGGLGPTGDDLTREGIAGALGDPLVKELEIEAQLKRFFLERGIPWIETNSKQALRPESCRIIPNPNGTAPGLLCQKSGKTVIALPGPKSEFDPMAEGAVKNFLKTLAPNQTIVSRALRISGLGESTVEDRVKDLMQGDNPTVAPYAKFGEVILRITAKASSEGEAFELIDPVDQAIRARLGNNVYGVDNDDIEGVVHRLLREKKAMVASAESITGGEFGMRFSSVPGASDVFAGGVITYTAQAKIQQLGIDPKRIQEFTTVSAEIALDMAQAVSKRFSCAYGVGISGNAGPTADMGNKPIGLVYVSIATPSGCYNDHGLYRGSREIIRGRATQLALMTLRTAILNEA